MYASLQTQREPEQVGGVSTVVTFRVWAEGFLDRIEKRVGTVGASVLVGLLLLLAGAVYVMPAAHCINHGCGYQEIATDPWHVSNSNPLRMRLLTPLLAYALGFRHERYIAFPMALVGVFLAQVYMYVRKRAGCSPLTALAVSTALATTTLLAHSLHHSGVQDPMQYCLLVAALANAGNPIIAPLAVGLGVMSHESTMFHVPWVTIAIWRERRSLGSFVTACVTMLVLIWIVFRIRAGIATAGGTLYTEQAYLSISNVITVVHDIALLFPLGTFMSLRAVWFVPIASAWVCWKGRHFSNLFFLAVIVGSAFSQLLLAWDTSRIVSMAFPSVLVGAGILKQAWGERVLAHRVWLVVVANLLIPQYLVGGSVAVPYLPLPVAYAVRHYLDIDIEKRWWSDCAFNNCRPY